MTPIDDCKSHRDDSFMNLRMSAQQWMDAKPMRDRWLDEICHADTKLKPGEAPFRVFWLMSHYASGMQLVAEMRTEVFEMNKLLESAKSTRERRQYERSSIVGLDERMRHELFTIKSTLKKLFDEDDRPLPGGPPEANDGNDDGGGSEFKGSPVPNPQVPPAMKAGAVKKSPSHGDT